MAERSLLLTDRNVGRLPLVEIGQHVVYDNKLNGFYLLIGRTKRTYMVRGKMRREGQPALSVKISVGDAKDFTAARAREIATGYLLSLRQGRHPKPQTVTSVTAVAEAVEQTTPSEVRAPEGPTLRQAWQAYKTAMIKKERSADTIAGYEDHIVRVFKHWADRPIKELADDPAKVSRRHDQITASSGPYAANGAMRTLRAVYNHAWSKNKKTLPRDNPVEAVDWNKERRRNTAMGIKDLPDWFAELAAFNNLIRREFHLLTLLSASRPAALKRAKLEHLDLQRRVLFIPSPKGGEDRAFDIPLSRQMIQSLMRVIRIGRVQFPTESRTWLFPAESAVGHIVETKELRNTLSKWGNDLRQTYRTVAPLATISGVDAKLLMNHAIPGVNEGYITREKIVEDHLRSQQQAISNLIMGAIRDDMAKPGQIRHWLGAQAARAIIVGAAEVKRTRPPRATNAR